MLSNVTTNGKCSSEISTTNTLWVHAMSWHALVPHAHRGLVLEVRLPWRESFMEKCVTMFNTRHAAEIVVSLF